jgi:hypothetical protein
VGIAIIFIIFIIFFMLYGIPVTGCVKVGHGGRAFNT